MEPVERPTSTNCAQLSRMFGGNSNWRGPVWMPVNTPIVRALLNLYSFYGEEFKVDCPTGCGRYRTLFRVAHELVRRLSGTFLGDANGKRPVCVQSKVYDAAIDDVSVVWKLSVSVRRGTSALVRYRPCTTLTLTTAKRRR